MEASDHVEPGLVIVIGDVDDQGVPLPAAPRIPHEELDVFRKMRTPVERNHTIGMVECREEDDVPGGLEDLHVAGVHHPRHTLQETARLRVEVLWFRVPVVRENLLLKLGRPRLVRNVPVRGLDDPADPSPHRTAGALEADVFKAEPFGPPAHRPGSDGNALPHALNVRVAVGGPGQRVAANGWRLGLPRGRRRQREDAREGRRHHRPDQQPTCHRDLSRQTRSRPATPFRQRIMENLRQRRHHITRSQAYRPISEHSPLGSLAGARSGIPPSGRA